MPVTQRSFVSYIDRTREFYRAQGYTEAYAWARHTDAPFTPLPRPLAKCTLGLVTTASPWREQEAVDGVLRAGKQVWSAPVEPPPERLFTDDLAWDRGATHTDDVPSFLPIPQLQAWVAEGRLGALAARFHGVPTDYSQRRTNEQDAPEILARLRADAADVALLVPL
jgi:hypothetical protein